MSLLSISKSSNKKFDKQPDTTDMPELESWESAAERKKTRKGLNILTPDQMLSRLPITLAQLKAGNNLIRQLLYSLYHSRN